MDSKMDSLLLDSQFYGLCTAATVTARRRRGIVWCGQILTKCFSSLCRTMVVDPSSKLIVWIWKMSTLLDTYAFTCVNRTFVALGSSRTKKRRTIPMYAVEPLTNSHSEPSRHVFPFIVIPPETTCSVAVCMLICWFSYNLLCRRSAAGRPASLASGTPPRSLCRPCSDVVHRPVPLAASRFRVRCVWVDSSMEEAGMVIPIFCQRARTARLKSGGAPRTSVAREYPRIMFSTGYLRLCTKSTSHPKNLMKKCTTLEYGHALIPNSTDRVVIYARMITTVITIWTTSRNGHKWMPDMTQWHFYLLTFTHNVHSFINEQQRKSGTVRWQMPKSYAPDSTSRRIWAREPTGELARA